MRRTPGIALALATAGVLAVAPNAAAAKGKPVKSFSCSLEQFAQGVPNPSGIHFGLASCPTPFGEGLHFNRYTVTPPSPAGPGKVVGTFKNYYNLGTAHGTFVLTFPPPATPGSITYTGTVTYTGGTARFKKVRGNGTIRCTTTDGGAHKSCTVNSKLTGI